MNGMKVKDINSPQMLTDRVELHLGFLQTGIYLISIETSTSMITVKLLKK